MEKFLGKVVRINWRDACHMPNEWVLESDVKFIDTLFSSVGKLIKTDEHYIMIAQSFDEEGTVANTFMITKAQIINIKELK